MTLPGETLATGAPRQCPDCHALIELTVCSSNAGYYVGAWCNCGPYCRESDYYKTHDEAQRALDMENYSRA